MSADRTLTDAEAIALTAAVLSRRFPGATVWYGRRTRRWWAVIRASGRWLLIEAAGPDELTRALIERLRAPACGG